MTTPVNGMRRLAGGAASDGILTTGWVESHLVVLIIPVSRVFGFPILDIGFAAIGIDQCFKPIRFYG